jgi:hypothetical protein
MGCEKERQARQKFIKLGEKQLSAADKEALKKQGVANKDMAWRKVTELVQKMTPDQLRSIGLLRDSCTLEQEDEALSHMVMAKCANQKDEWREAQCAEAVKKDLETRSVAQLQASGLLSKQLNVVALVAEAESASCAVRANRAKVVLEKERAKLEEERRLWEEAVVRLARPKTCRQLLGLATGGRDGVYTVFPPEHSQLGQGQGCLAGDGKAYSPSCNRMYHGQEVYCDMLTDSGGWTLVGYAEKGRLGSRMTTAHGKYTPMDRRGSANLNAICAFGS